MKQIITFLCLTLALVSFSQDQITTHGLFYKISLATTLGINEDYQLFDEGESGTFLEPSAYFINNTMGYKFDERSSLSLNFEYNWHSETGFHFFPAYMSLRYNIIADDDNVFIRTGYGRLLNFGKVFETGTMYKVGAGIELFDEDYKNSLLFGLDFSRKRFGYKQAEKLSSISIFFEFMVF